MQRKRKTIIAIIIAIALITVLLFALSRCNKSTKNPEVSSTTEATSENTKAVENGDSEATTSSETEATVAEETPELTLTDWHMEYYPEDEYSDLEAYTYIIMIQSSKPIPEGMGISIDLTLTNSEGEIFTGKAHYYGDVKFDGLQNFSLSFSCHNYLNDMELLDKLSSIETIEAEFSVGSLSTATTEDAPYAFVELMAEDLSFEIDSFGMMDPLLKFENTGYADFGECVLFVEGSEEPVIIHVGEDFDSPTYLSGFAKTTVDLSQVESVFYCVNYDVTLEIG